MVQPLQNEYFSKEVRKMSVGKMGLTIEEAAESTGIGRNTMRKLIDWGKLPVLKVGRKTIIRKDALERFMEVNQGRNLLVQNDVRRIECVPSQKPSALESEIHPLHKSDDLFKRHFALPGACIIASSEDSPL